MTLEYEGVVLTAARRGGLSTAEAERAVHASLETLAERLTKGEARQLVEQLPLELAPWLLTDRPQEPLDVDEFVRRVAKREDVDVETAEQHARAVFAALREAIDPDEFTDLAADLPDDFLPIVLNLALLPPEEFVRRVATRTGLEMETARAAVSAVLETLAMRLPPGEVDDLIARLPVGLHDDLRRGEAERDERSDRLSAEEFVRRVAARERTTVDAAAEHVLAVLATLREAVGAAAFSDIVSELPPAYTPLLPRP